MGVMAMPIIVLASQEALEAFLGLKESAYGVGCTQWQVTKDRAAISYAWNYDW